MSLSEIRGNSDVWKIQLSLFDRQLPFQKDKTANSVDAITSGKIALRASEIGESTFTFKISYMGGSYSLNGEYRTDVVRSFSEEDYSNSIIRIRNFYVLKYRDGRYISDLFPLKESGKLMKYAQEILSSPYHRTAITIQ